MSQRKMEPLRWTPYMDDCIRVLSEEKESELDILLVTQAKCHVLMNQITRSPNERAFEGDGSKAPPTYYVKAMQVQLQHIRRNLPIEIKSSSQY